MIHPHFCSIQMFNTMSGCWPPWTFSWHVHNYFSPYIYGVYRIINIILIRVVLCHNVPIIIITQGIVIILMCQFIGFIHVINIEISPNIIKKVRGKPPVSPIIHQTCQSDVSCQDQSSQYDSCAIPYSGRLLLPILLITNIICHSKFCVISQAISQGSCYHPFLKDVYYLFNTHDHRSQNQDILKYLVSEQSLPSCFPRVILIKMPD